MCRSARYVIPVSMLIRAVDEAESCPLLSDRDPDLVFLCLDSFKEVSPGIFVLDSAGLGVFGKV